MTCRTGGELIQDFLAVQLLHDFTLDDVASTDGCMPFLHPRPGPRPARPLSDDRTLRCSERFGVFRELAPEHPRRHHFRSQRAHGTPAVERSRGGRMEGPSPEIKAGQPLENVRESSFELVTRAGIEPATP